ncbi:Hypothetical protein NGAL_HAMBI1145_32870 [Neorhizobium galegae bv. officinalis]|uniref:Uncharacterized protein n=1 Tax=Neorhizobium galegae bv. officinalis TaxID=323656 RepID=A0A0T7FMQ3_NEOGA|nr:hypothetical protein [Neorhizobium galegae]CDZ36286.1 Hypothetical protein NGAL_HAMBI1145_32870 [Neorhizobium galegae bv. officinalis]
MKPIYLDWSDAEGVSFNLRTSGLWPFEVQEISAAFLAAGYVGHGVSHFVSTTQPNPGGPQAITDALEAIRYKVEHQGEAAEAVARERHRQGFEAVDKIEPFAAIQPTEEVAAIRTKWIAGEISDEEAIASVQAMLDEFDGRKPH